MGTWTHPAEKTAVQSNVTKFDNGSVLVSKVTILECFVEENSKIHPNADDKYINDVGIKMKIDYGAFQRDEFFGYNFGKEKTMHGKGAPSSLGGAYYIVPLFFCTGIDVNAISDSVPGANDLNAKNGVFSKDAALNFYDAMAKEAVGAEINILRYMAGEWEGKPSWNTYKALTDPRVEGSEKDLYDTFRLDYEKGYVKKYTPHLAKEATGASEEVLVAVEDDDAPF